MGEGPGGTVIFQVIGTLLPSRLPVLWVEPRLYHMLGKCFNTESPILGSGEYHACWLVIPSGRVWKESSY